MNIKRTAYQGRIRPSTPANFVMQVDMTVGKIFNCSNNPTDLTPRSLWQALFQLLSTGDSEKEDEQR